MWADVNKRWLYQRSASCYESADSEYAAALPSHTGTPVAKEGIRRHSATFREFEPALLNGLQLSVNRKLLVSRQDLDSGRHVALRVVIMGKNTADQDGAGSTLRRFDLKSIVSGLSGRGSQSRDREAPGSNPGAPDQTPSPSASARRYGETQFQRGQGVRAYEEARPAAGIG
jgi:hypothetical protein